MTKGAFTADSVGNVYVEGHEDQILVQEIEHRVTAPTDPQSGQPSGQRVHKPLVFTCALNKAVPLMYQSLASGEMLPNVEVQWFRTSVDGKQEHSSPPSWKTPPSWTSPPCCRTRRMARSPTTPS
ncbi:type VI secretion system tube protein TssD [Dyella sp.]|uniref:type VI secretion system tube protein TssD n=1 Tax=Dyella sp. TaxID=1869338 RepID=UPI0031F302F2